MRLTADFVRRQESLLNAYYSTFFAQCRTALGYLRGEYPNVKVPEHLHKVAPPIAKRVIYGLAQQVPVHQRIVHCDPAEGASGRPTAESQRRSSERENAHRAAFAQDDIWAIRRGYYPPTMANLIEGLAFGLSAGVVLPNELALAPEPVRRAGEGSREFERRRMMWDRDRLRQPALPHHCPGILNLLIDPGLEFVIWRFRLPRAKAEALMRRWGQVLPSGNETTVLWKEAYSAESRLCFLGNQLVKEWPGYGFLPLSLYHTMHGEAAIYSSTYVELSGPEHLYQGILAGCESTLDDLCRKETQLANFISKRVWPKQYLRPGPNGSIPADFKLSSDPTKITELPRDVDIVVPPTGDLPPEVWTALKHGMDYIDSLTQIDAMQGYRQAESGYQEAILAGLAAGVLRPFVWGLDLAATQVAELRTDYVVLSDYFEDGLDLRARIGGEIVRGQLSRESIDSLQVEVSHHVRLPQQRMNEEAFWRQVYGTTTKDGQGFLSGRTYLEKGAGVEDPESEWAQRMAEDFVGSEEVQRIQRRDIAQSYDADLARRIEEEQAASLEQIAGAIQQNRPTLGGEAGGLAPPGAGLQMAQPPRPVGQPTPALTPEQEADLIIRQAQRRSLPGRRR